VVICYLRQKEAAERTCAEIEERAVKAVAIRTNVGDESQLGQLFSSISESFGRLDVFISNAATGVIRPLHELDARAWSWTMDANARSLFLGAKAAGPLMSEGGRIVALSSQGASRVLDGYMVVGASKAAIESLGRYLAVELAPKGITVNVVSPGVVDTDALRYFPQREEMLQTAERKTPVRRLARPQDVAHAVDFLTSSRAAMITGHTLVVDGGASLLA
jgi:enoyl-[acyl-carrier protein] reductase III